MAAQRNTLLAKKVGGPRQWHYKRCKLKEDGMEGGVVFEFEYVQLSLSWSMSKMRVTSHYRSQFSFLDCDTTHSPSSPSTQLLVQRLTQLNVFSNLVRHLLPCMTH